MKALLLIVGGLVVWGAVTGKTGAGGPPTAATEIPTYGGHGSTLVGLLVVAGLVALFMKAGAGRGAGRATSGRRVSGHTHHGPSRTIARHEAGHAAAARALGGRVRSARADRHGGYVEATLPAAPPREAARSDVAFLRAGRRAAGTGAGCSADDKAIRDVLRQLPASQRGQVRREGDRDARRIVNGNRGQIRRDAATLERRGRL